ncbi:nucleotide exchange factor GrpE [Lentzea sp. HUAS12]|uniref:nucleotide exchange factor GrpE n=1 Tax=Lentzea sp. HUAS12 TaxID=2951806 RepID=UPI0020A1ED8A|nr:nucleotide exchange factor GrpE [Lentzea sp. HUAS12]USX53793.1 nucleotide exchange factor GrpE [Lentzea sp. HUAS12]
MTSQGNAANAAAESGAGAPPSPAPVPDVAELEDRWLRSMAELDNTRKRHSRELERQRVSERARVASAWLPVLDNLELALEHASDDALAEGVRATLDQAVELLARLGYPRQDATGVPFDPAVHEVVTVLDDPDAPPNTVVRVLRPGYGDLRPAAVAVARARG